MKIRNEYTCPLEIVHDIVKGKWKPIIIFQLRNGVVTLANLERQIQGINQKMLIEQLKELKEYGIVKRTEYEGYPLRVEYSLTSERGKKMLDAVLIMQDIGIDYMKENGMADILKCKGLI
jgi:DNA-binding HxlR family transcriptional regulator